MEHDYRYQAERFDEARSALMLPHPQGEATSIASAFNSISRAFHFIGGGEVRDETAKQFMRTIEELMEPATEPGGDGSWLGKARTLTDDQKIELSRAVDYLATWFNRQFWAAHPA